MRTKIALYVMAALCVTVIYTGCGNPQEKRIIGVWQGELEGWNCELVFYEDNTGSIDYDRPMQRLRANFEWSVKRDHLKLMIASGNGLGETTAVGTDIGGPYKWVDGHLAIRHPDTDIPTVYYPKSSEDAAIRSRKIERVAELPPWHTRGGVLVEFTTGRSVSAGDARNILETLRNEGRELHDVRLEMIGSRYRLFGYVGQPTARLDSDLLTQEVVEEVKRSIEPEHPDYSVEMAAKFGPILGDITAVDEGRSWILKVSGKGVIECATLNTLSRAQADRLRGLLTPSSVMTSRVHAVVKGGTVTVTLGDCPNHKHLEQARDNIIQLLPPEFGLTVTRANLEFCSTDDHRAAARSLSRLAEDMPGIEACAVLRIMPSLILVEVKGVRGEDLSRMKEMIMDDASWKQGFAWSFIGDWAVISVTPGP